MGLRGVRPWAVPAADRSVTGGAIKGIEAGDCDLASAPNIVLIVADDMGYGDFGVFNFGASHTPALDHLQSEGLCLDQHYSGAPVCAPARAALLSGRYPHRTGAIDTFEALGTDRLGLGEVTLADLLRRQGCATGLVGKWHNGAFDDRYHPNRRGFDEFVGFRGGWQDYWAWRIDRNGVTEKADGRYLTHVFTEEAVSFLRRHRRERFFLHLAYNAPHFPLQAPPRCCSALRGKEVLQPGGERHLRHASGHGRGDRPCAGGTGCPRDWEQYAGDVHQRQRTRHERPGRRVKGQVQLRL